MPGEILVIAEHWRGHAESITLQLLTKGRELADALGVGLDVLVLGHDVGSVVASLKDKGADAIHTLDHAALGDAACGALAEAAVAALRDIAPKLTLVGHTLVGMELGPAIATRFGAVAMTNCVNIECAEGEFIVTRPVHDGALHAKIALDRGAPALCALQKGATPTLPLPPREAQIRALTVDVSSLPKIGRAHV